MTNLHSSDSNLNAYFQNRRIRQYLINSGLINRRGDILPEKSYEVALDHPRPTKEKASRAVNNYVIEEEHTRQEFIREQFDFTSKHACVKRSNTAKQPRRVISNSLGHASEHHGSTNTRPPAPTDEKRSPVRAKSAHHSPSNKKKRCVRRSATAKAPTKDRCRVVMIYYGPQTIIDYDDSWFQQKGDEILVSQQHCGGENLIVYKGYVEPNETFSFESRRHPDYPFALALYINGLIDSRISVCCEYKHKQQVPLGGKSGSFGIHDVHKVKPCRSCRYIRRKKKSRSTSSVVFDPSRYQKSVVPHDSLTIESHSSTIRRTSNPPRASSKARSHSPAITRTPTPPDVSSKTQPHSSVITRTQTSPRISSKTQSRSPIITRSPSPPGVSTTTQRRSPPLTRTPSPTLQEEEEKPSTFPTSRISHVIQNNHISNKQSSTSSDETEKSHDETYTSDFDEPNNNDHVSSASKFDRPHISESQLMEDSNDSDDVSKTSSRRSGPATPVKDNSDHTRKNNAIVDSRRSSSGSSRKSGPSEDKKDNRPSRILTGGSNASSKPRRSSSNTSRKSGPLEDKNDQRSSRVLTGKTNLFDTSRRPSSSSSRKSGPSPRNEVNRELNSNNNNNDDWFSSTNPSRNNTKDRPSISNSVDRALSAKKSEDIHYSSKKESEVRHIPTSSSQNVHGNNKEDDFFW